MLAQIKVLLGHYQDGIRNARETLHRMADVGVPQNPSAKERRINSSIELWYKGNFESDRLLAAIARQLDVG